MKMKKKAAIAAAVFTAAINFSACDNYASGAYGPPEIEEWRYIETDTETVSNDDTTQSEEETSPDNSEKTEGDEQQ